jgi:Transcriptional regulators
MEPRVTTVRELAKLAGVSPSAVSLALRNHPRVSQETRARVLAIAKERGYAPDPLTSTLMGRLRTARKKRQTERLAFLTWWGEPNGWRRNRNNVLWFEGARDRAQSLGYTLEQVWAAEPGLTSARLGRMLYSRGIRGVITTPFPRSRRHLKLDWRHFAVVGISKTVIKPEIHQASHFHHNGILLALHNLKRRGYRRVGLVNLMEQVERVRHGWISGNFVYQQSVPEKNRVPPLILKEWSRDQFAAWLERHRPDAILSSSSAKPLQFLRELGLSAPGEIGFASLDLQTSDHTVSGIDQQHPLIAAAAVDLVTAQLQRNEFGLPACPTTIHLNGVWRDGATTRPPPQPRREMRS